MGSELQTILAADFCKCITKELMLEAQEIPQTIQIKGPAFYCLPAEVNVVILWDTVMK